MLEKLKVAGILMFFAGIPVVFSIASVYFLIHGRPLSGFGFLVAALISCLYSAEKVA